MKKFNYNFDQNTCPASYSAHELDSVLCVYDFLIDSLIEAGKVGVKHSYTAYKIALFTELVELQENEGVAGFRTLASLIGLQIDRSLSALRDAGLLEDKDFVFDLELVPEVISEVHARFDSFPHDLGAWFIAVCDQLGIDDPRKAYQVTNDNTLTHARIRDQLPFMADLLRDTGGATGNPKLFKDFQTAFSILAGTMYANVSENYQSLLEFILEAEGNGVNHG